MKKGLTMESLEMLEMPYSHHQDQLVNIITDNGYILKVNGVQELTIMSSLKNFDIVNSVAIDPMHGLYGGVVKMMLNLWFDSCHHKQTWYCKPHQDTVNSILLSIRPPSELTKIPRSLDDRKYWKGIIKVNNVFKHTNDHFYSIRVPIFLFLLPSSLHGKCFTATLF